MPQLIFLLFIPLIIVIGIAAYLYNLKLREAMQAIAAKLNLRFYPAKDRHFAKQYKFLNNLHQGSDRYAFNIMTGKYQNNEVTIFNYHYTTGSGKDTHTYYFTYFTLILPSFFPELTIGKEHFFSKIAQAIGYDDIDFESHEFSRKFCVRSKDKKLAYDICNAQMIEYLLQNEDLTIEIENNILAISFNKRLSPELIEPNLNRLIKVRSLFPDYIFSRS